MTLNGPVPLRSQMTRFHSDRRDPERVAREGWKETGILAVNVNDERFNDFERQFIKNLAVKMWGREGRR